MRSVQRTATSAAIQPPRELPTICDAAQSSSSHQVQQK